MREINSFTDRYRFLSNFYRSNIMHKGLIFPTVEHAYQWEKMITPEDKQRVYAATTPGEAKRIARRSAVRPDWDKTKNGVIVKDSIMEGLLNLKYDIYKIERKLLATKDAILIEGNTWGDTYWGVCNGVGLNKLGIMTMQIRANKQIRNIREDKQMRNK
jgi:ribA/ribD-fused uncharacterized protein